VQLHGNLKRQKIKFLEIEFSQDAGNYTPAHKKKKKKFHDIILMLIFFPRPLLEKH